MGRGARQRTLKRRWSWLLCGERNRSKRLGQHTRDGTLRMPISGIPYPMGKLSYGEGARLAAVISFSGGDGASNPESSRGFVRRAARSGPAEALDGRVCQVAARQRGRDGGRLVMTGTTGQ